jgi:20S proteasome subunit beta 2
MGSNGGGFSFDLCKRNALLERKGMAPPSAWKTGTTIAGVVFKVGCCESGGRAGALESAGSPLPAHSPASSKQLSSPPRAPPVGPSSRLAQDGVVLGADTRSTSGSTVADKNCEKIHYIAPNIYCCGAGTAADTMNVTAMISSALDLHRYATGRQSRIVTAMTMLKSHLFRRAGWRARSADPPGQQSQQRRRGRAAARQRTRRRLIAHRRGVGCVGVFTRL